MTASWWYRLIGSHRCGGFKGEFWYLHSDGVDWDVCTYITIILVV
jgi:hypothetical protein